MRSRHLLLASACAALAGCAMVFLPKPEPLARAIRFPGTFETYPTGLRGVTYQTPGAARATVTVSYGVGYADDPPGKEGLAHLAEHLSFRARSHGATGPQIKSRLLALGAAFNGATTADSTAYLAEVPHALLPALMTLEAQRMRDPLANVTDEAFRAERDVVLAELREHEEDYEGLQMIALAEVALSGHAYARHQTAQSLASITLEDVRAFCKRHYVPSNAIVVVSGAEPPASLQTAIGNGFEGLAGGRAAPRSAPKPNDAPAFAFEPVKERREVRHGPVELPQIWMAWTVPGTLSRKTVQIESLTRLFAGALKHVLFDEERVDTTFVFPMEMESVSLIVAFAEVRRAEDVPAIEEKLKNAAAKAREYANAVNLPAKAALMVQTYREHEALPGMRVASWVRATGRGDYLEGLQKQIVEVLDKPLDAYAFEYVTRDRAATLVVLPDPAVLSSSMAKAGPGALQPDEFAETEDLLQAGEANVRKLAAPPKLDAVARWKLRNGLDVIAVDRQTVPVVDVRLVVRAVPPPLGKALAVSGLAFESSRGSATEHSMRLVGAARVLDIDDDHLVVGARAADGNLLHVLDDVARWAREQPLHAEVFIQQQKDTARAVERENLRVRHVAEAAFLSALYPAHAYGTYATADEVKAVSLGDARGWIAATVRPERSTLVIVGDLKPTPELRKYVDALFGPWRADPRTAAEPAGPAAAPATIVRLLDRPGATHASLKIGFRLQAVEPKDRAAAEALAWWLERRLDRELREKIGASYGAVSELERKRAAGALTIQTSVDRGLAAAALQQVSAEIARVAAGGLSEPEAQRARWQLARMYDLRFATTYAAADRLVEAANLELPADYWEQLALALPDVTSARLAEIARQLDPAHAAIVVVGDAATLAPQLEAAGYKVERLAMPAPANK